MADRVSKPPELVRATDEHAATGPMPTAVGVGRRRSWRSQASPHSGKFRAATAVLAVLAIGAIALAVAMLSSSGSGGPTAQWSQWSPADGGTLGAREIADHVAPLYRISPVAQLAVVTVVNLSNPNAASAASAGPSGSSASSGSSSSALQVAVRADPSSSAVSVLSGHTIAYNLCGVGGPGCAIGVGQPSAGRLLLLRREALELALYTFRYISATDNVVAILPPGHTTQTCTGICPKPNTRATTTPVQIAALFVHDELKPWLTQPLSNTLPEPFPPTVDQMAGAPEAGLVDQITARGLFSERLVQAQDGSNLIVLDPLPPQ